jgi:hypothetical protein
MQLLLIFTMMVSFANGLIKQMISNSLLNANEKMCKNCKHFMPQSINEGELPIGDYYGKCEKFRYKYLIGDEEDTDYKFAIYCRMNDKLCGKKAKYYEDK